MKEYPRQEWSTPLTGLEWWLAECKRRGYGREQTYDFLRAALDMLNPVWRELP